MPPRPPARLTPPRATVAIAVRVKVAPTCSGELNDVEPFGYLRDVLERLSGGHQMSRLDDLLPWNWHPTVAAAA